MEVADVCVVFPKNGSVDHAVELLATLTYDPDTGEPTWTEGFYDAPEAEIPKKVYWRADTGYKNDNCTSAADVVLFERDCLGNDLGINSSQLSMLTGVPARGIVWVTTDKEVARRYGEAEQIDLGLSPVVIARDGDGGILMVRSDYASTGLRTVSPSQPDAAEVKSHSRKMKP